MSPTKDDDENNYNNMNVQPPDEINPVQSIDDDEQGTTDNAIDQDLSPTKGTTGRRSKQSDGPECISKKETNIDKSSHRRNSPRVARNSAVVRYGSTKSNNYENDDDDDDEIVESTSGTSVNPTDDDSNEEEETESEDDDSLYGSRRSSRNRKVTKSPTKKQQAKPKRQSGRRVGGAYKTIMKEKVVYANYSDTERDDVKSDQSDSTTDDDEIDNRPETFDEVYGSKKLNKDPRGGTGTEINSVSTNKNGKRKRSDATSSTIADVGTSIPTDADIISQVKSKPSNKLQKEKNDLEDTFNATTTKSNKNSKKKRVRPKSTSVLSCSSGSAEHDSFGNGNNKNDDAVDKDLGARNPQTNRTPNGKDSRDKNGGKKKRKVESNENHSEKKSTISNVKVQDEFIEAVKIHGGDVKKLQQLLPKYTPKQIKSRLQDLKEMMHGQEWMECEKEKFRETYQVYGKDWERIEEKIGTRSKRDIESYFASFQESSIPSKSPNNAQNGFGSPGQPSVTRSVEGENDSLDRDNNKKEELLLCAIAKSGSYVEKLLKDLPGWSDEEINDRIKRIRDNRQKSKKPWTKDENSRLQQLLVHFGVEALDKLVNGVGTRHPDEIKRKINKEEDSSEENEFDVDGPVAIDTLGSEHTQSTDIKAESIGIEDAQVVSEDVAKPNTLNIKSILESMTTENIDDANTTKESPVRVKNPSSEMKEMGRKPWQGDEILRLNRGIALFGQKDLRSISQLVRTRTENQIKRFIYTYSRSDKPNILLRGSIEGVESCTSSELDERIQAVLRTNDMESRMDSEQPRKSDDSDHEMNHSAHKPESSVTDQSTTAVWTEEEISTLNEGIVKHGTKSIKELKKFLPAKKSRDIRNYIKVMQQDTENDLPILKKKKMKKNDLEDVEGDNQKTSRGQNTDRDSLPSKEKIKSRNQTNSRKSLEEIANADEYLEPNEKIRLPEIRNHVPSFPNENLSTIAKRKGVWEGDEIDRLNRAVALYGWSDFNWLEKAVGSRNIFQIKTLLDNVRRKRSSVVLLMDAIENARDCKDLDEVIRQKLSKRKTAVSSQDLNDEELELETALDDVGRFDITELKARLSHYTESNIQDLRKSIRNKRRNKAWTKNEIDRLQLEINRHDHMDIEALETAIGTRTEHQIRTLLIGIVNGHNNQGLTLPDNWEREIRTMIQESTMDSVCDKAIKSDPDAEPIYTSSKRRTPLRSKAQEALVKISISADVESRKDSFFYDTAGIKTTSSTSQRKRRSDRTSFNTENITTSDTVDRIVTKPITEQYLGEFCSVVQEEKKDDSPSENKPSEHKNLSDIDESDLLAVTKAKDVSPDVESEEDLKTAMAEKIRELSLSIEMPHYIEELSFHFFAGRSVEDKLKPLPEALPLPSLPNERWTFDEGSRVLLVDFRNCSEISSSDKQFLSQMMQRDDITIISEGLLSNIDARKWSLSSFDRAFAGKPYHKFRCFDKVTNKEGFVSYVEQDKFKSMKITDYLQYLRLFQSKSDSPFEYTDADGNLNSIKSVSDVVFYMIDIDMPKLLPVLDKDYKSSFRIPEILPGGRWCMMNVLPDASRPFMGPNCYLTPGGGYTNFHQDGHGTVDSGHSNLSGYNEVVMLRRLPECHKLNACKLIPALEGPRSDNDALKSLYKLPHDDGRLETLLWPTTETIGEWKRLNYYPSVFILKPGQHVHINKGRLHAFRKLTCDDLPLNDCHHQFRRDLIQQENLQYAPICLSVAFDWMFMGSDKDGINREVSSVVECAALCRDHNCKSLAIPETALLNTAMLLCNEREPSDPLASAIIGFEAHKDVESAVGPSDLSILAGILPSLQYIQKRDKQAIESCNRDKSNPIYSGVKLKYAKKPDTFHDPLSYPTDPYGSDYFCMICNQELSNSYFHCNGCEVVLNRDFNICSQCYSEDRYLTRIQIHPTSNKWYSDVNHVGDTENWNKSRGCPCKAGMCRNCSDSYCKLCSCKCHKVFINQFRYIDQSSFEDVLKKCEAKVAGVEVTYTRETLARLQRKPYN